MFVLISTIGALWFKAAQCYVLVRDHSGQTFFNGWDFYGSWDNLTLGKCLSEIVFRFEAKEQVERQGMFGGLIRLML
jgi:hypothetical protein